jgi:hypothetical protein
MQIEKFQFLKDKKQIIHNFKINSKFKTATMAMVSKIENSFVGNYLSFVFCLLMLKK